jgi:general secretion pathway protein J
MNKQRGFTLIELLIAMAITAVLSVMAYQAIDSVVTTQTVVSAKQKQNLALQRAIWWLEQDVIQMAPRAVEDGLGAKQPALSYRQDLGFEMTRFSAGMTPLSASGLLRVGYVLEDRQLKRLIWPSVDRVSGMVPKKITLLDQVSQIQFRFLDQRNQWQQVWPKLSSDINEGADLIVLPKLVELTLNVEGVGVITRLLRGVDHSLWLKNEISDPNSTGGS